MRELIILGIPLLLYGVLYAISFEKKLKSNRLLLILTVLVSFVYGVYLIGLSGDFSFARIFLIVLFFIGGLMRMQQFVNFKYSDEK